MKEGEPKSTFTSSVREFSHKIIEHSASILTINETNLETELVSKLQEYQKAVKKGPDPFAEESLSPENELGMNLFLDVVNFCYRDPTSQKDYVYINKEGKSKQRAVGLKAAMVEADMNWGDVARVSRMTPHEWSKIIQLDNNSNFYLGAERGKRIALFADLLYYNGMDNISDFLTLLDFNTDKILPFLAHTDFFTDEFQKRSQLAVNMMDGVLKRRFGKEIKGTETLTVMADYRLPQLMYNFGTIELDKSLEDTLKNQVIITTGSPEELALRAATVVVGERLSKIMGIPEGKVDSLLWEMAVVKGLNGEFKIPHMLVATDKY